MRVLIAGGGIGGLAAALNLHAAGIEAQVVEAARELLPLGVGINLLPHAVRELTELGLADELSAAGIPTAELVYHDRFGSRIWAEPRGVAAGYRWPQYSIHRGELQLRLLAAVKRRLGAAAVRTGLAVERFEQTGAEVRVALRDRATGALDEASADVLVGADGIHSAVRAALHPGEGPPRWNGVHMWRGVTEGEPFLTGRSMIMAGSNLTAKFVAYPISRAAELRGRAAINWVAEVRLHEGATVAPESWDRRGRLDDVSPHFAAWRFPWLDVPALIAGASAIFEYPMVDRDPLPWWSAGRVTLLGDAAHPMYPIGSNGASQAILDARVLAWHLARLPHLAAAASPEAALAGYEAARRPPTSALVLANRAMGPERVMALVEQRAPRGFGRIEDALSRDELEEIARSYKAAAGFQIEELNARPSWSVEPREPARAHARAAAPTG
ncbi:flavin-dependent oxidoreductase [Sorangium sp. So ce1151]|uniref:flavin-dependent oxidoreductase n=1 Tax=Sorangium sp. So ce1151 TaxID=3133332 RepID=UPI003F62BAF9